MPFHPQIKFFIQINPFVSLRRTYSPKLSIIHLLDFLGLGRGKEDTGQGSSCPREVIMGETHFLRFQITPLCYTNLYLARGSRPWDSSKAAVPKYDSSDVFLSITTWEGRRKKSPVSVLLPSCWRGTAHRDVELFQGLPGTDQVCSGAQAAF